MAKRSFFALSIFVALLVAIAVVREIAGPRVETMACSSVSDIPIGRCAMEQLAPYGPIFIRTVRPPSREWVLAAFGKSNLESAAAMSAARVTIQKGAGAVYNDMLQEYFGNDALDQVRFSDEDDAFAASVECTNGGRLFFQGALTGMPGNRWFFVVVHPLGGTEMPPR